jgi:hypothetical protein
MPDGQTNSASPGTAGGRRHGLMKYVNLFLAPWVASLVVLMLALLLFPPGFKANLTGLQQVMALHPNTLYSTTIGLTVVGLLFALSIAFVDASYWATKRFGPGVLVFLSQMSVSARKKAEPIWEPGSQWVNAHLTQKQKDGTMLGFVMLVILSGVAFLSLAPTSKPSTLPAQMGVIALAARPGTPVLLKMRVPLPAAELARSEAQYKSLHITKQQLDNPAFPPPPQLRTTKSKIISGRAIVKQIGPNTYEVRMVSHDRSRGEVIALHPQRGG